MNPRWHNASESSRILHTSRWEILWQGLSDHVVCLVAKYHHTFFFFWLTILISVFLGSDPALMRSLPPCICGTNVWPAAVIKQYKKGDTSNFMPCCSVTQSQNVRQRAAAGKKTIMRPNLGVAIFGMYSDDAARLPDSMAHLIRVVDSELWHSTANNY